MRRTRAKSKPMHESMSLSNLPLFKVFMAPEAADAVHHTLLSGFLTQGPKVDLLEAQLCQMFDHPYILTLNSATSGLTLALRLLERPDADAAWPGMDKETDIVLSCPLTCSATNWSILATGCKLQWVDADPETCNICLRDLERKMTRHTKVIYVVHWGGTPVDLDALDALLDSKEKEFGFRARVVEDCAHSFLTRFNGRYLGTSGSRNLCVYSLQAIKHFTTGDGGLIFLPNQTLYDRAKLIRWFGIDRDKRNFNRKDFRLENDIPEWGYKFHMNDINATIGLGNLPHVAGLVQKHKDNAAYYNAHIPWERLRHVRPLKVPEGADSAYWIYTLLCDNVAGFIEFMQTHGITCSQVHRRNDVHSCVSDYTIPLPQLDALQDRYVCIPVGWWLSAEDVARVVDAIVAFDAS